MNEQYPNLTASHPMKLLAQNLGLTQPPILWMCRGLIGQVGHTTERTLN